MKLRNLMYASMIACAFASCSKDDVVGPDGPNAQADAKLSLQIATPKTKSGFVTDGNSAGIQSLTVYVFNDDKLQTIGSAGTNGTANGTTKLEDIAVSAGTKKVVVVANTTVPEAKVDMSLTDFYNETKDFTGEVEGSFSMNSKTYTVDIQPNVKNFLGYTDAEIAGAGRQLGAEEPIKLYRNVAKIDLVSVTLNTGGAVNEYKDATLKVTDVFLLHAAPNTKVVGGASAWNATNVALADADKWLGGATNTVYGGWVAIMKAWKGEDETKKARKNYVEGTKYNEGFTSAFSKRANWTASSVLTEGDIFSNEDKTSLEYFYAFENLNAAATDIHTLLVVKGTFEYGAEGNRVSVERFYPVSVGLEGLQANPAKPEAGVEREFSGVLRNVQYNVALTVMGPGYETPFGPDGGEGGETGGNTILNTKVEVVDFGSVGQIVPVE